MRRLRATFLVLIVLANLGAHLASASSVLCIESDGCISIEDATLGCCSTRVSPAFVELIPTHDRSTAQNAHEGCGSCVDIAISGDTPANPSRDGRTVRPVDTQAWTNPWTPHAPLLAATSASFEAARDRTGSRSTFSPVLRC